MAADSRQDYQPGQYKDADQQHRYEYDAGVIVMPLAGAVAGHRLIRLHGGVGTRRVSWHHSRTGNPPIIPAMADTTGDTFLGGSVAPNLPTPSVDGKGYDWSVSGEYVYVQNAPRIVGENALPVGQHPFVCVDQATRASDLMEGYLSAYVSGGFDGLMTAAEQLIVPEANGSYLWPLLGHPTLFTSTSLIQD